ncbi:MAG: acetate--CoA ligase family protein [Anaerolineaceae bacterium]
MDKIFYPDSVVVIGTSEKQDNLGRNIAENFFRFNYKGKLYLVGRNRGVLNTVPIFDSMNDLPEGIDLAVILTPAALTPGYLEQCGQKGILNVVIETAGFGEFSEEGKVLGQRLAQIAHKYGIRIVGPNCIGITNTASGVCTVFVKVEQSEIAPGRTSLMSQSGGVMLTMGDMLTAIGLGVGKEVSVGNKLDYKESDYLDYFLKDQATDICMMYLESIDNGRGLVELAARGEKPIIVYKANTGLASHRAAQSHTAALANDDQIVNAALKQFGILRAKSFREMMLFAKGLSLPPVRGNKLCVFTRSGGHAVISADTATEFGFDLDPFPPELIEKAKPFFRADVIDSANPLDLGTIFDFNSYVLLIEECLRMVKPDAVVLTFNYRRETIPQAREIATKLKEMSWQYNIPIALCYFTELDEMAYLERNLHFPIFQEVYDTIQALAASRDYYLWQQRIKVEANAEVAVSRVPQDARVKAEKILQNLKGSQPVISDALAICEAYGIPIASWVLAKDATEAIQLANQVGYPLTVKAVSEEIVHKSDIGGVMLNIRDEQALLTSIQTMQQRIHAAAPNISFRFLLQKMVGEGREVFLGGKRDLSFGPVLLFGLGGIYVEVFKDVALRLAPLSQYDAAAMINEIQGIKLLQGVRGEPGVDIGAIQDTLLKLSQMMIDLPVIQEIDLNPVIASPTGVVAVDARFIL